MADPKEHKKAVVAVLTETPPALGTLTPESTTEVPSALPELVPPQGGTLVPPAQQENNEKLKADIFDLVRKHNIVRGHMAKEYDAPIVAKLGIILTREAAANGAKNARSYVAGFFNDFVDVDRSVNVETPAYGVTQLYHSKEVVEAKVQTNPRYRQFFTDWADLARWEARLFKPVVTTPQGTYPGEFDPFVGGKDVLGRDRGPIDGITINGKVYAKPSEALMDGLTRSTVYQAWKNTVKPRVEILDQYPSASAKKALFSAAAAQAEDVSIIMREKRLMENGKARLQKVRRAAGGKDPMPTPALLGIINGLIGIAITRTGVTVETIKESLDKLAAAPDDKAEHDAADTVIADNFRE